jgi:hypothetical protein
VSPLSNDTSEIEDLVSSMASGRGAQTRSMVLQMLRGLGDERDSIFLLAVAAMVLRWLEMSRRLRLPSKSVGMATGQRSGSRNDSGGEGGVSACSSKLRLGLGCSRAIGHRVWLAWAGGFYL